MRLEDYEPYGLADVYLELISFAGSFVERNYSPFSGNILNDDKKSDYAQALTLLKASIKEVLEYLKSVDKVYINNLSREVVLNDMKFEEQKELIFQCKQYMLEKLYNAMHYENAQDNNTEMKAKKN